MRSLVILVATTAVVSGLREMSPGFSVDFRSFGGPPIYKEQRLPSREQSRSFREVPQPPSHQQLQPYREEFRVYRQPFSAREETRMFHEESRGGFKGDARVFKEEHREPFKEELRSFGEDSRPFGEEVRGYRDESGGFREERTFRDAPRQFRDERPFRDERRPFREELRPYREEYRTFREESRPFREDFRQYEGPKVFREEPRPFRDDRTYREESESLKNGIRGFKEDSGPFRAESRPFREEITHFRDDRPFREESRASSNGPRPFKDDSGPLRSEPRPFTDDPRSFKEEILFGQESQSLAEAHQRYNKEQEEQRQPLSFGGHSNYLKFGNHGLGFASVPAAVLPLEDNSASQRASEMMRSELSQTAATQSPGTSSPREIADSKSQISVTLAPEVGSTPSQSPSGNTIDGNTVDGDRKNEQLVGGVASTSQDASTAVTISTSGGTNVTPKVGFGSGSAEAMHSPPMRITGPADSGSGAQQANTGSTLHASKSSIDVAGSGGSYFTSGTTTTEVPAELLNYIFKYQMPQEAQLKYVYRQSLPQESFSHIQTIPLVHQQHQQQQQHQQAAKFAFLPDFKIPGLSGIQEPAGTINYVSTAGLPRVSYLNSNALPNSYSADSAPPVNFARNLIQLDQGTQFPHLGQTQLSHFRQIGQNEQLPQLKQLTASTNLNHLGQFGQFGQNEHTRSNPFSQGGLQLQLGGFGGIDYSALSSNSEASRASPAASLGIAKVGLSFPEPPRPPAPAFTKVPFGESLW